MAFKDFFSGEKARFFWYNILAMMVFAIVLAIVAMKGLDYYTDHGKGTQVPNVIGMHIDEANILLLNHKLSGQIIDSVYVKGQATGTIIDQNPTPGCLVKGGRSIYLTINAGDSPLLAIPDIIDNCSFREAEARLKAAGFHLGEPEIVQGEKDWVYGITCRGVKLNKGDKVKTEDLIVLQIGSGEAVIGEGGEMTEGDSLTLPKPKTSTDKKTEETSVDESWF